MPTYEYACPKCGIVEAFQSIKEDALTKCPQCKKAKVQRMVSLGGGVIFKGSGFWETDYNRSSDYQSKSKSENGEKNSAPGKSEGAGEAKTTETKSGEKSGGMKPSETKSGESKTAETKPAKADPPQPQAQPQAKPAQSKPKP